MDKDKILQIEWEKHRKLPAVEHQFSRIETTIEQLTSTLANVDLTEAKGQMRAIETQGRIKGMQAILTLLTEKNNVNQQPNI